MQEISNGEILNKSSDFKIKDEYNEPFLLFHTVEIDLTQSNNNLFFNNKLKNLLIEKIENQKNIINTFKTLNNFICQHFLTPYIRIFGRGNIININKNDINNETSFPNNLIISSITKSDPSYFCNSIGILVSDFYPYFYCEPPSFLENENNIDNIFKYMSSVLMEILSKNIYESSKIDKLFEIIIFLFENKKNNFKDFFLNDQNTKKKHSISLIKNIEIIYGNSMYGYSFNKKIKLLKITLFTPNHIKILRDYLIYKYKIKTYESNYPYILRFMTDIKLVGSGWIICKINNNNNNNLNNNNNIYDNSLNLIRTNIKYFFNLKDLYPYNHEEVSQISNLKIISFDIECLSEDGHFPKALNNPVILISLIIKNYHDFKEDNLKKITLFYQDCDNDINNNLKKHKELFIDNNNKINDNNKIFEYFNDEKDMLIKFANIINIEQPDIITGYNVQNFDIPYLVERAKTLNINNIFDILLGKVKNESIKINDKTFSSSAYGTRTSKEIKIPGILVIDVIQYMYRNHKLSSYSLNNVSYEFLKKTKEDVHYSQIPTLYRGTINDKIILCNYCDKDALLPIELNKELKIVVNYIEMARVSGVPIDFLISRGQQIKVLSMIYRKIKNENLNNNNNILVVPYLQKESDNKYNNINNNEQEDDDDDNYDEDGDDNDDDDDVDSELSDDNNIHKFFSEKNKKISKGLKNINNNDNNNNVSSLISSSSNSKRLKDDDDNIGTNDIINKNTINDDIINKNTINDIFIDKNINDDFNNDTNNSFCNNNNTNDNNISGNFNNNNDNNNNNNNFFEKMMSSRDNYFFCKRKKTKISSKTTTTLKKKVYEGATVIEPDVGFYKTPIATLDFASLYPSIMMKHNLCTTTWIKKEDEYRIGLDEKNGGINKEDVHITPVGYYFVNIEKKKGILVSILEELISARSKAKKDMNNAENENIKSVMNGRQLALKISANSVYGFTGAISTGSLPCIEISSSVTSYGRDMINIVKKYIENEFTIKNGYDYDSKVIYGDTDSVMVNFCGNNTGFNYDNKKNVNNNINNKNNLTVSKAIELGKIASDKINRNLFKKPISIEFEKVYYPYILMKKKRYVGLFWSKPEKYDKMDIKGIELARRDNCNFVKIIMKKSLELIMEKDDPIGAVNYIRNEVNNLIDGKIDISQLVISKSLTTEPEKYKSKQPHAGVVLRMKKKEVDNNYLKNNKLNFISNKIPVVGDRVPFVFVSKKTNDHKKISLDAYEKSEDPLVVLHEKIPIDYEFYFFNHVLKPITKLFMFVINNFNNIDDKFKNIKNDDLINFFMDKTKNILFFDIINKINKKNLLSKRINYEINQINNDIKNNNNGNILNFIKISKKCLICKIKNILNDDFLYCDDCKLNNKDKINEYQNNINIDLENKKKKDIEFKSICMKCQGDHYGEVICQNTDCEIFYSKENVIIDIEDITKKIKFFI